MATVQIQFIGCDAAPFSTTPLNEEPPFRVRILYPTGKGITPDKYTGPIIHELSHVYQLKHAGSYKRLQDSLDNSNERIEMGADFLAGLVIRKLGLDPSVFEGSDYLTGNYHPSAPDSHGLPPDRSAAFEYGYQSESTKCLDSQYTYFQDNDFARIKNSNVVN